MGTVNYMAPEQLLGQRVDRRCDVFSFGVVLCEMLTGTAPFVHENRIDTMHAILHREPSFPSDGRPELPFEVQRILVDGDLAMVHVKASRPGAPDAAVADIYRFEDGRIVEHWDVLQPVPAGAVHDHPMF